MSLLDEIELNRQLERRDVRIIELEKKINKLEARKENNTATRFDVIMNDSGVRLAFEKLAHEEDLSIELAGEGVSWAKNNPYSGPNTRLAYKTWCCAIGFERS